MEGQLSPTTANGLLLAEDTKFNFVPQIGRKSPAWSAFNAVYYNGIKQNLARCITCGRILGCKDNNTSGLLFVKWY
jgi:hypothetical protein